MAMAMQTKVDDLFGYVQERCLWQFFSRTWDRQENIDGVLAKAADMLSGREPVKETPMDRLYYADAMAMVADLRERLPWISESDPQEVSALMEDLKARLVDTTITRSKNRELNDHLY